MLVSAAGRLSKVLVLQGHGVNKCARTASMLFAADSSLMYMDVSSVDSAVCREVHGADGAVFNKISCNRTCVHVSKSDNIPFSSSASFCLRLSLCCHMLSHADVTD